MSVMIDSYATNWIRVTDTEALRTLIAQFAKQGEPCIGGRNWTIEDGLGDSLRVFARELSEGDLSLIREDGTRIELEAAIKDLLQPEEVLAFFTMSWHDDTPQFSCRVYSEGRVFETTHEALIRDASTKLSFPMEKVIL